MKFSMNDFMELDLNALLEVNGGSGYCASSYRGQSHSSGCTYNYRRSSSGSGSCNSAAGFCGKATNSADSKSAGNSSAPATEKYLNIIPWKNPGYIVNPKEPMILKHREDRSQISAQSGSSSSYFTSL